MSRWARLAAVVTVAAVVVLPAILYISDALVLRYRLRRGGGRDTVTVYLATRLKNGKLQVFTDRPQTEVCARALFPHLGLRPCWYVRRSGGVKEI